MTQQGHQVGRHQGCFTLVMTKARLMAALGLVPGVLPLRQQASRALYILAVWEHSYSTLNLLSNLKNFGQTKGAGRESWWGRGMR